MCFTWFREELLVPVTSLTVFELECDCHHHLPPAELKKMLQQILRKSSTGAPIHGLRIHGPLFGSELLTVEIASYGEHAYVLRRDFTSAFETCHDIITRRMTGLPRAP